MGAGNFAQKYVQRNIGPPSAGFFIARRQTVKFKTMARKGGQLGNVNAARPFAAALRSAIAHAGKDRAALIDVARVLLEKAMGGDLAAIREVADRLDGKAVQATDVTINDNRAARDLTDAELVDIAAGGGAGDSGAEDGAAESAAVH